MFGRRALKCSFCRRSEAEVAKLVAGPRVFICDRCVATAQRMMDEAKGGEPPPAVARSGLLRRALAALDRLWHRRGPRSSRRYAEA